MPPGVQTLEYLPLASSPLLPGTAVLGAAATQCVVGVLVCVYVRGMCVCVSAVSACWPTAGPAVVTLPNTGCANNARLQNAQERSETPWQQVQCGLLLLAQIIPCY